MALYLGIDIGHSAVRAVKLHATYRGVELEATTYCELDGTLDLADAVRLTAGPLVRGCDSVCVNMNGEQVYFRRFELPPTAQKQLANIVPGEVADAMPFDAGEALLDFRALRRSRGTDPIIVVAAVARVEDVRASLTLVKAALSTEPEVVVPGAFALASLVALTTELAVPGPILLVDLGAARTEVLVLANGEPAFARTLSVGTSPAAFTVDTPAALVREIRQTMGAWRSTGGTACESIYLTGGGVWLDGAMDYFARELGAPVLQLPAPKLTAMSSEQEAHLPRFAKAVGLAMACSARARTLNMRQGPLAFERGYGYLRERIPALAGLASVILVSFFFSTWAEMRALDREHEVLAGALGIVTKEVFGDETRDAAAATTMLEKGEGSADEDPLPRADAFDVLVELAEAVSPDVKHDIEEIDVQRASAAAATKVVLRGIVPNVQDAEDIRTKLETYPCFHDVKIVKTSQQIGGTGQKYLMELDLRCRSEKEMSKLSPAGSSTPASSAKVPDK